MILRRVGKPTCHIIYMIMKETKKYRMGLGKLMFLAAFALFGFVNAHGQAVTTVPYFCGFEDASENSKWSRNAPHADGYLWNEWKIGSAVKYAGSKSLYISGDYGATNSYYGVCVNPPYTDPQDWYRSTLTFAWREFRLPAGTYDLSFLWRCEGGGNNGGDDVMGICWAPASTNIQAIASPYYIPSWVNSTLLPFEGRDVLKKSRLQWIDEKTQIVSTGAPMKLVVVWKNDDYLANQPPGAIDNITITACPSPKDVKVVDNGDGSATMTWSETNPGSQYEIDYGLTGQGKTTISGVSGTSQTIYGLPKGAHEFRIRANCGGGNYSLWSEAYVIMSREVDENCIDFIDLDAPGTICKTADVRYGGGVTNIKTGVVDYGFKSMQSRMTVHYPGETDPRTLDRLPTVPPGEEASVRLGSWNGGEQETIQYTMNVPAGSKMILTMKYSVLLEAPGHGGNDDPFFLLQILDRNGNELGQCTSEEFWADRTMVGRNGWNFNDYPGLEGVVWKDWTTIGVDLQPYAGQTIKIKLLTSDCVYRTHFGYAYFTLKCSDATITGLACGQYKTDTISAPDGFLYEWYKESNPGVIVSRDQHFVIPSNDMSTYKCKVTFMGNAGCSFVLEADQKERYPKADFNYVVDQYSCDNQVTFQNTSGVIVGGTFTTDDCESYFWDFGNGQTSTKRNPTMSYPVGGTYKVRLVAALSEGLCTDTMEMDVVVKDKITRETIDAQICTGDTYTLNGQHYTTPGTYTQTVLNGYGCDSIITLNLQIGGTIDIPQTDSICTGTVYNWYGNDLPTHSTGVFNYRDTVITGGSCDSVFILTLSIFEGSESASDTAICEGDPLLWQGTTHYLGVGNHVLYDSTLIAGGCYDIKKLDVKVNPNVTVNSYDQAFENQYYEWNGTVLPTHTAGTYYYADTLVTASGCDSVVNLTFTVVAAIFVQTYDTVCQHDPYTWQGRAIPTDVPGTKSHLDSLKTPAGNDSILELVLTVNPEMLVAIADTVCQNDAYIWAGENVNTSRAGSFTMYDTLQTVCGCDSMVTLSLEVMPLMYTQITDLVCQNDTYVWDGANVNTSVATTMVLHDTLTSVSGCDSIVELTLTVSPTHHQVLNTLTVCQNDAFPLLGDVFTWQPTPSTSVVGEFTYRDTMTTWNGCDSTFEVKLIVNPVEFTQITDVVCQNEPYMWAGVSVETSNVDVKVLYDTLATASGCDSVVELTLTINEVYQTALTDDVCRHETYVWLGNVLPTGSPGQFTYHDTLPSANGCDSALTLTLNVHPTEIVSITDDVCQGESYVWGGKIVDTSTPSVKYLHDTLTTVNGCDSMVELVLTIHPIVSVEVTDLAFQNYPYIWNGNSLPTDVVGTFVYNDTLTTIHGCDSLVKLTLDVVEAIYIEFTDSICQNDPYTWQGESLNTSTSGLLVVRDTFQTTAGNDSIVDLKLMVNPNVFSQFTDRVCQNASYTWQGQPISTSIVGIYTFQDTLVTIHGCDSVVQLTLTVDPVQHTRVQDNVCQNEPYTWNGQTINTSTAGTNTYTANLQTVHGCDSVVELSLTVVPNEKYVTRADVCQNTPYTWNGQSINTTVVGQFTYSDTLVSSLGCDSVTELVLNVVMAYSTTEEDVVCQDEPYVWNGINVNTSVPGVSVTRVTLQSAVGCDSVVELRLTIGAKSASQQYDVVCQNDTYTWNGLSISTTTPGVFTYNDTLRTSQGCDSIASLILTVAGTNMNRISDDVCQNEPYMWNGSTLNTSVVGETTHTATLTNASGCDSTVILTLTVTSLTEEEVYDTICFGDQYVFDGKAISEAGHYTAVGVNDKGCPHTTHLYLTVHDKTVVNFDVVDICADADFLNVSYTYDGSPITSFSAVFDESARAQGFDDVSDVEVEEDGVLQIPVMQSFVDSTDYPRPDVYNVTISMNSEECGGGSIKERLQFSVLYPSWIIEQHWNDAIALLNDKYNKDYVFSSYQWYRGEDIIYGAVGSYYYTGPHTTLQMGQPYYICLERVGENKPICSCPIYPKMVDDINDITPYMAVFPTYVPVSRPTVYLETLTPGYLIVYDTYGHIYYEDSFDETKLSPIYLPPIAGMYMFYFVSDDDKQTIQKVIVY